MAMIWDAPLVSALADELKTVLVGKRLRGHTFRWEERELALHFENGTLTWRLHPRQGWVTFDSESGVPEDARPLSATVTEILAAPDERVLEIQLSRSRGRVRSLRIVVELMSNQWNALLLDDSDSIRHLLWTRHLDQRSLSVGQPYRPPPPSSRMGTVNRIGLGAWRELLEGKEPAEARKVLLEQVAFTSPINVDQLLGNSRTEGPSGWDLAGVLEGWERLKRPEERIPCVLETGRGLQPYHIVLNGLEYSTFPTLLDAIHAVSLGVEKAAEPSGGVEARLERALHRARGRVKGLRRELASATDPEKIRARANLLLARLAEVPRGVESVRLKGFDGEDVVLTLDPSKSPQDNAQALYQEATRKERAQDKLPSLLAGAESLVRRLETLAQGLKEGTTSPEAIARELPGEKRAPGLEGKQERRLPYRRYKSSGGLEIRVGRGSRDNDTLTFRHSHPEDVWLHARGRSGAHVILRWRKEGNPPQRDLAEAATLAALHSGSRTSGTVPVDWTRRKYVRKPRRAPPGTVLPDRVQTLFVVPDPELPDRLQEEFGVDEG